MSGQKHTEAIVGPNWLNAAVKRKICRDFEVDGDLYISLKKIRQN